MLPFPYSAGLESFLTYFSYSIFIHQALVIDTLVSFLPLHPHDQESITPSSFIQSVSPPLCSAPQLHVLPTTPSLPAPKQLEIPAPCSLHKPTTASVPGLRWPIVTSRSHKGALVSPLQLSLTRNSFLLLPGLLGLCPTSSKPTSSTNFSLTVPLFLGSFLFSHADQCFLFLSVF